MNSNKVDIITNIRYEEKQKHLYANRKIDQRVRIDNSIINNSDNNLNINNFPFSAIGALFVNQNNKYWLGTASLISPSAIITAAHNIFIKNSFNADYKNCLFYIGLNNDNYSDCAKITKVYLPYNSDEDDYAVLILDKPLGDIYGYFNISNPIDYSSDLNICYNCYGYPGDKIKKNKPHYEMWGMKLSDVIVDNKNELVEYVFDSYSGLSGSGVYYIGENGKSVVNIKYIKYIKFIL